MSVPTTASAARPSKPTWKRSNREANLVAGGLAEVIAGEVMVRFDLVRRQFGANACRGKDVDTLRKLERQRRFLFDQQDTEAFLAQAPQRPENFSRLAPRPQQGRPRYPAG